MSTKKSPVEGCVYYVTYFVDDNRKKRYRFWSGSVVEDVNKFVFSSNRVEAQHRRDDAIIRYGVPVDAVTLDKAVMRVFVYVVPKPDWYDITKADAEAAVLSDMSESNLLGDSILQSTANVGLDMAAGRRLSKNPSLL